jgi:hypothetical protein
VNEALTQILEHSEELLKQRKYQEAIDEVRPILIQDTGGLGQKIYGMALLGLGQHFDAVQPLMVASQTLPNDVTIAFAYGTALTQEGNPEGARAAFERGLGIDANHPGCKQGYANASKALADRDSVSNPMKAVEWLYGPWQKDPGNPQWAGPIIDLYISNGWNEQAHQFAAMLPEALQNSPTLKKKLGAAPIAPPVAEEQHQTPLSVATAAAAGGPRGGAVGTFEACPFCKQQIMVGVHTCPHCKMIIRSKAMPGQDYKASWQEVTLNILCWIGILLAAFDMINAFVTKTYNQPAGGYSVITSVISIGANILILQRNDFAMSIGKWLYVIRAIGSGCCLATSISGTSALSGSEAQKLGILMTLFLVLYFTYCVMMVYLLNYEGAE